MSAGRGRGRGRGLLATKPAENRPGSQGDVDLQPNEKLQIQQNDSPLVSATDMRELEDYLQELTIDIEEEHLDRINTLSNEAIRTEEDLKSITHIIYSRSKKDREFAKTAACVCDRLSNIEVQGTKFRNTVLKLIQEDFKVKDTLRQDDNKSYLGFFTFLCQIYNSMRLATGEPFKPLVIPIYDCFEMILSEEPSTEDEFECLSLQLQSVGKDLDIQDSVRMTKFLERVRSQIIKDGLSPSKRCILLEMLEYTTRGWKQLPNDVTRFYCDTMVEIFATSIE